MPGLLRLQISKSMPTMVAPVIMAAGIVVGVTTGKIERGTALSSAAFDLAAFPAGCHKSVPATVSALWRGFV